MNTPPLDTQALVLMLKYDSEKNNDKIYDSLNSEGYFDFKDDELINHITSIGKYFALDFSDLDNFDYLNAFLKTNMWKLSKENFNYKEYTVPNQKQFIVYGSENYSSSVVDNYELHVNGYTTDYIEFLINTMDIMISDGKFSHQDVLDTWDTEQVLDRIVDKTDISESYQKINENNKNLTKKDFLDLITNETDIELLDLMLKVIEKRKKELNF